MGTQPYVWRPVEAVSDDLADVWRLLKKPSWALSPMSGGQWRPSAMSCPHLAAAGEAVVGTQPYVWRPVEAVSHVLPTSGGCWRSRRGHSALCLAASGGRQPCPAHIWRLLEKPSWALSLMSGGQWRPSAMIWLTSGGC